jgi:predicted Zn-dependent peptidase
MRFHLKHERLTLSNGLRVILHPDTSLPLVAVNLWYRVGSKDERPGKTGFAHLFEHLMFMGTDQVPGDSFDRLMEAHGGANNATTSTDRTNYYCYGPRHILPALLWLEADRMATLGRSMTQKKLDLQRKVVKNERRQSYENRPYGRTWLAMPGLIYPQGHPYHHPTIGSHQDLENATVEDVQEFFETWYRPNNASLVIAGDFDRESVLRMLDDWFAKIPAGSPPPHRDAPDNRISGHPRLVIADQVPADRTVSAWASPRQFQPGDAACDIIASVLSDGAASRLEQALMHRRRLASNVSAFQSEGILASEFIISATALEGVPLAEVEGIIHEELERLLRDGPTEEEIARAVNSLEADTTRGLQSLLERADTLNEFETWLGDPDRIEWDMERYRSLTPEAIVTSGKNLMEWDHFANLQVIRGGRPSSEVVEESDEDTSSSEAGVAFAGGPELPVPARFLATPPEVSNVGAYPLWHIHTPRAPLVSLEFVVPHGAEDDAEDRRGELSLLLDLMTEGARNLDSAAYSAAIDMLGSRIAIAPGRSLTTLHVFALERNLKPTLDLAAAALHEPRNRSDDFERVKALHVAQIKQRDHHPDHQASIIAHRELFADVENHRHPLSGYAHTVAAVTHEDVARRYDRLVEALSSGIFVAAGSVDAGATRQILKETVVTPGAKGASLSPRPPIPLASKEPLRAFIVPREKAPQTVIRLVTRTCRLGAPESPAIRLANTIFGGSFTSRLNQNLRERHGFTYGASTSFRQAATYGIWTLGTTVKSEVTERSLIEIFREMERLRTSPFTEEELLKARASERTDRIQEFESTSSMVGAFAPYAAAGLTPESATREAIALESMDLQSVRTTGITPMTTAGAVLVLVGHPQILEDALKSIGISATLASV